MILQMNYLSKILPAVFFGLALTAQTPAKAADLTPEQVESLKAKIEALKKSLDSHLSSRNEGAGSRFLAAAADPRAAVELYLECHKTVNFDREGLKESDFRAWKETEADTLRDDAFVEALQMQLRYLGLSCKAAEVKDTEQVFTPLTSYVDSLSKIDKWPEAGQQNLLMQSVANSIFAQAFYLEKFLGQNENWEAVPFNIGGMYEKTILPHLREESPQSLMAAWDRRISQETLLVEFFEEQKEKQLRGMDRDQERRTKMRQNRGGGIMGSHDKDDFLRETLPNLQWSKLKDQFLYIDQLEGAKAMVDFIEKNLTHPKGEDWFSDFTSTITSGTSGGAAPAPAAPAAE